MKAALSIAVSALVLSPAIAGESEPAPRTSDPSAPENVLSPKAVLIAYVAAWNRHDPAALDPLLNDESVHEDIPAAFHGKGAAKIKAFAGEVFKEQPDLKWRLTTVLVSGSTVAAEWTWTSTYTGEGLNGPVKGQKISARGATFLVVEGGHVKRFVDYYDFASALAAANPRPK